MWLPQLCVNFQNTDSCFNELSVDHFGFCTQGCYQLAMRWSNCGCGVQVGYMLGGSKAEQLLSLYSHDQMPYLVNVRDPKIHGKRPRVGMVLEIGDQVPKLCSNTANQHSALVYQNCSIRPAIQASRCTFANHMGHGIRYRTLVRQIFGIHVTETALVIHGQNKAMCQGVHLPPI